MGACLGSGGGGTVPIPITELCGATGSVRGGVMLLFNMSTGIDAVSILLIGATVISTSSSWFTAADEENGVSGAQIDLLIDRRDGVISMCEMKHSINEFEIDKKYDMNLRNKIGAFIKTTNCKKTIQVVMITTYGVKDNMYSGIVNSQVVLDDLFYQ